MALYDLFHLDTPYGAYPAQTGEASVSAGNFLKPTGTTEATTTTYNKNNLIEVSLCDGNGDEALMCGIALDDQATSGGNISVGTKGVFLMEVNDAVTAGAMVCPEQGNTAANTIVVAESGGRQIGIALTPASADGEYALVLMTGLGPAGAEG